MEILLYNFSNQFQKGCDSWRSIIPISKNPRFLLPISDINFRSLNFLQNKLLSLQNPDFSTVCRSSDTLARVQRHKSRVSSRSIDNYVVNEEDVTESISSDAQTHSCFWEWKPKLTMHYEKSGCENVNAPAMLLLPGFGVGSFHYEMQVKDLGRDYKVYAIDFLGQGLSLPMEDPTGASGETVGSEKKDAVWGFGDKTEPWADQLVYSIDLWRDQVKCFIEEVIQEPVYLVGNSLGGYVAIYFAACYPHLVKGVTLLNATPFWGFLPNPTRSPLLSRILPWSGTFPLPKGVQKITEFVWRKLSDPASIAEILKQVYADQRSTNISKIVVRIVEITRHPAATAAFASIMFAPCGQLSFNEALSRCEMEDVPICLMYGREDPWVKPIWGLQIKRQMPNVPYYEISPAGHCPHHEVPEVVNLLLRGWIEHLESEGSVALPLLSGAVEEDDDQNCINRELEFSKEGSKQLVKIRFYGSKFSIWNILQLNRR